MAGVDFQRPGVVDVEAEYAPRYSPSGAVCDRERRNLLAPVAPRKPGPGWNWWPTIVALRTHRRDRVHRQLRNRARDQHSPNGRSGTSAHESGHADRKRKPCKSVHGAPRRPSVAQPDRHQSRGLTHRRSHTNRVRYADRVRASQFPTPIRSTAMPTSSAAAPVVATTSHAPAPATGRATPAASKTAKASAPVTTEPTPVTQSHSPTADILPPFSGMPRWLEDILLATGLLAATAFAAEPVAVLVRRRRQRGDQSTKRRK